MTPHQREADVSITAVPQQQHIVVLMNIAADSMGRHKFARTLGPGAYMGCGVCQFQVSLVHVQTLLLPSCQQRLSKVQCSCQWLAHDRHADNHTIVVRHAFQNLSIRSLAIGS